MSQDPTDDTQDHHAPPPPSLEKAPATGDPRDEPLPPAAEPPSIWQPLDGSAPRVAVPTPTYSGASGPVLSGMFGGAGSDQQAPPPHAVAAAYAATAQAKNVFTLAGWGRRLGAFLIDSIVFGIGIAVLVLIVGLGAGMTVDEASLFFGTGALPVSIVHPAPLYVVFVLSRLLLGLLPAYFLVRWDGQTPGKRALGLRVMRGDGSPMTFAVALRREVLGRVILLQIASLVSFGLAGLLNYLWPLWDAQRRAGHDFVADTRVVVVAPAPPA